MVIDRFLDYFASRCLLERETSVGSIRGPHPLQVVLISGESGAGKMLSSATMMVSREVPICHSPPQYCHSPPPKKKHRAVMNIREICHLCFFLHPSGSPSFCQP